MLCDVETFILVSGVRFVVRCISSQVYKYVIYNAVYVISMQILNRHDSLKRRKLI
jgi:hypothetical protein